MNEIALTKKNLKQEMESKAQDSLPVSYPASCVFFYADICTYINMYGTHDPQLRCTCVPCVQKQKTYMATNHVCKTNASYTHALIHKKYLPRNDPP